MSFSGGIADFSGPLSLSGENASLSCGSGAQMRFGGGQKHKIGGLGMKVEGFMTFDDGEIEMEAPFEMDGPTARLNLTRSSKVCVAVEPPPPPFLPHPPSGKNFSKRGCRMS